MFYNMISKLYYGSPEQNTRNLMIPKFLREIYNAIFVSIFEKRKKIRFIYATIHNNKNLYPKS